jgi:hypothetical protein
MFESLNEANVGMQRSAKIMRQTLVDEIRSKPEPQIERSYSGLLHRGVFNTKNNSS